MIQGTGCHSLMPFAATCLRKVFELCRLRLVDYLKCICELLAALIGLVKSEVSQSKLSLRLDHAFLVRSIKHACYTMIVEMPHAEEKET